MEQAFQVGKTHQSVSRVTGMCVYCMYVYGRGWSFCARDIYILGEAEYIPNQQVSTRNKTSKSYIYATSERRLWSTWQGWVDTIICRNTSPQNPMVSRLSPTIRTARDREKAGRCNQEGAFSKALTAHKGGSF